MSTLGLLKFAWNSHPRLLLRLSKTLEEMCRAAFVSALVADGVGERLLAGPASLETLHADLGLVDSEKELQAWLDVGVSLGELDLGADGYRLKGLLARRLSEPESRIWHAFFQARTDVFFDIIRWTPDRLRKRQRFAADPAQGELFAQSSRTVEPLMLEVVDKRVPEGKCRMLEVGCGSGVYLKRACDKNAALEAVGIELTAPVAGFARDNIEKWGLSDRVQVEVADARSFDRPGAFDLVTFYNLIYYFPMDQRVAVLAHLRRQLSGGGRLLLVTLTRAKDVSMTSMNLWSSMTEGQGPLPSVEELDAQLAEAGFSSVKRETLIPGFWVFDAA